MRAPRFRPTLDRLDDRKLLSGASVVMAVSPPTSQMLVCVQDQGDVGMMPGEEIDGPATWGWIVAGAPPCPTYDLFSPPVASGALGQ